ncbi:hypothetical protein [Blautia sp.]
MKGNVAKDYKDRLFRMIFNDREKLLELYNAMNDTDYTDASELQIVTLENAIYMSMKNDVAYVLHDELFLYEQQSTKNANMPLRCLFYVSDSYSAALVRDKNIYGTKLLRLPSPTFVVFYNGKQKMEEEGELRLSDAFIKKQGIPNLELIVKVKNINMGNSQELFEKCRPMRDYMIFVGKVRKYSKEKPLEEAVEQTIRECMEEDVMADFLEKNRAEVMKMCIYEYDEEKQREFDREEGREEERQNTLREKARADEAFRKIAILEKQLAELMK